MSIHKLIAVFGFIVSAACVSCGSPEQDRLDPFLGHWVVTCTFLVTSPALKSLLSEDSVRIERAEKGGVWFPAPNCGQDNGSVDVFLTYDGDRKKYLLYPNTSSPDAYLRTIADSDRNIPLDYSDHEGFTSKGDVRTVSIEVGDDRSHVWKFSAKGDDGRVQLLTWKFAPAK